MRGPQRSTRTRPSERSISSKQVEKGSRREASSRPRRRRSGTAADRRRRPGPSRAARRRRPPRRRRRARAARRPERSVSSRGPRFAPSPTYASVTRACARRPPPRSRRADRARRPACAHGHAHALDRRKALDDPVRHGTCEPLEQEPLLSREHLPHQRSEPPIVDGVVDAVALRRVAVHVDPEIDEEPLAEPALLLEVAVVAEDHQARAARSSRRDPPTLDRGRNGERLDGLAHVVRADHPRAALERGHGCCERACRRSRGRAGIAEDPSRACSSARLRPAPADPACPARPSRRRSSRFWSGVLPKPIPGSTQIRSSPIPCSTANAMRSSRKANTSDDDVVVVRSDLHRSRLALHVHETDERVSVGDDRGHVRVAAQGGDVVDEDGPQLESPSRDRRFRRVDREREPAEPFENGLHARELLLSGDRRSARTRRLAAHVDEGRALLDAAGARGRSPSPGRRTGRRRRSCPV